MHVAHVLALALSILVAPNLAASESDSPLLIGADIDYAPFSYLSEGRPAGFDVAFLELVLDRMGREGDYLLRPWQEVHDLARAGQLDLVLGVVYTPEREGYLDFSDPYNTFRFAVLVRPESAIRRVTDLESRRLAHLGGDVVAEILVRANDVAPVFVPHTTLSDAVTSVRSGLTDGAIVPLEWARSTENRHVTEELTLVAKDALVSTYRIGIVRPNPALRDDITSAVADVIASPEYTALRAEWFGDTDGSAPEADSLSISGGSAPSLALFITIAAAIAGGTLLFLAVLVRARRP